MQAFIDDRFLVAQGPAQLLGLQDAWASSRPSRAIMAQGALCGVPDAWCAGFHAAGIEVILDVVYNHTGEGDELGPDAQSSAGSTTRSYYRLAGGGRHYVNDTGTGNTLNLTHPMVLRMVMDSLRYWVETLPCRRLPLRPRHGSGARGAWLRPERRVLRRDPAGPGPGPGQADRRALGYRAGRLSAGGLSASVPRMERPVPRRRAAVLARRCRA